MSRQGRIPPDAFDDEPSAILESEDPAGAVDPVIAI